MWNWIKKAEELQNQGIPFVITTVAQNLGSTPRESGAKMLVLESGQFFGTVGGGHLEQKVIEDAKICAQNDVSQVIRYPLGAKTGQCCGGIMDILFETVHCGPRLYLFGAGHVGQAVCRCLASTSFVVHVVDSRSEWIESPELPPDVIRHSVDWSEFIEDQPWDAEKTYVAIMTHRHDTDQEILQEVLTRPAKYIGLIGSDSKWKRFQQRLVARGVSEEVLKRVKCPIGIPIGGKSPQEVAISLAAELIQMHNKAQGEAGRQSETPLKIEKIQPFGKI